MKAHLVRTLRTAILVGLAVLFAMFSSTVSLAQEIIVDNRDANTSQTSGWSTSSGPAPYLGNSVWNSDSGGRFTWVPALPTSAEYDVYAWWTYHKNRSDDVPYHIKMGSNALGDPRAQVNVNQRDPDLGGRWNYLGTFFFYADADLSITVSSENGQANADAVKFVRTNIEWPEVSCPCDEYFSRAVDKYLGWGGSLTNGTCDDPNSGPDFVAQYSTGASLKLEASFVGGLTYDYYECSADASTNASDYYRDYWDNTGKWFGACRASIYDFCASD